MINYFQVGVASVATDTNWFVDDEFCLIIKVGFNLIQIEECFVS